MCWATFWMIFFQKHIWSHCLRCLPLKFAHSSYLKYVKIYEFRGLGYWFIIKKVKVGIGTYILERLAYFDIYFSIYCST
jgi:hypothetical protein